MKIYYYGLNRNEAFLVARIFFKENNIILIKNFNKCFTEKYSIISGTLSIFKGKASETTRLVLIKKGKRYRIVKWSDLMKAMVVLSH